MVVAVHYEAGPVRELIHQLKYDGFTDLVPILSGILSKVMAEQLWDGWVVVPIPLHASRLSQRGFNQADLLGGRLARALGLAYQPKGLVRARPTPTQTGLSRRSRSDNLYRAFRSRRDWRGAKVLLVDDVMTTGATLADAARACKDAGAKKVWATVIARG